jgi:hypothetical protein
MADVFLSYSHKDTDFVRDLVKPLEAEGFSVWWDHTIPPGKTWDEVIARGIREAKACIIVWSANSVGSDWVKEEATIAKEGGKYLPIQLGVDQPPMGFRRIQAADLSRWNGNSQDPQWRLLVTEIATLVGTSQVPRSTTPVTAGRAGRRTLAIVGTTVVVVLIAVAGYVGWGFRHDNLGHATQAEPPVLTSALPASPQAASASAQASLVGVWQGWYHLDTDAPNQRTPLTGTFQADGSMIGQSGGRTSYWRWQQSGLSAQWTNGDTTYTASVTNNHMIGTISYGGHTGNFEASR